MLESRKQRLEDLGFVWDPHGADWEEGFSALVEYKETHRNCRVVRSHKMPSGFKLGEWCARQRYEKKKLTAERLQLLIDLGFIWDPVTESWEASFSALAEYKQLNGDCRVPQSYKTADGLRLGAWVDKQRQRKEKISAERIKRLEELDFVWATR